MGLYIKDMGIPKSCFNCKFPRACQAITRRIDEMVRTELFPQDHRHSDCPITEVPEPHGRLIDADAMIRDIEKSLAPSWYIKERNADMVKFLSLEDTVIPASWEAK